MIFMRNMNFIFHYNFPLLSMRNAISHPRLHPRYQNYITLVLGLFYSANETCLVPNPQPAGLLNFFFLIQYDLCVRRKELSMFDHRNRGGSFVLMWYWKSNSDFLIIRQSFSTTLYILYIYKIIKFRKNDFLKWLSTLQYRLKPRKPFCKKISCSINYFGSMIVIDASYTLG